MRAKVELTTPSEIWIVDDIDLGETDSEALKTTLLDIILKAERARHIGTKTITKYGNVKIPKDGLPIRRKFECANCGCIFETTRFIESTDLVRRVQFWASLCPCCAERANEYRPPKPPNKIKGLAKKVANCFKGSVETMTSVEVIPNLTKEELELQLKWERICEESRLKETETSKQQIATQTIEEVSEKETVSHKVSLAKPPLIKNTGEKL